MIFEVYNADPVIISIWITNGVLLNSHESYMLELGNLSFSSGAVDSLSLII